MPGFYAGQAPLTAGMRLIADRQGWPFARLSTREHASSALLFRVDTAAHLLYIDDGLSYCLLFKAV